MVLGPLLLVLVDEAERAHEVPEILVRDSDERIQRLATPGLLDVLEELLARRGERGHNRPPIGRMRRSLHIPTLDQLVRDACQ